ncbi:hypothetical protein [Candidatus Ruminimicrobiellum ovillum]|uniref:hypothetical protein n=1 Tax=Candidatus Ruminimicrobiellum ovillum TaxID=1947927 RepID=UPI00355A95B5
MKNFLSTKAFFVTAIIFITFFVYGKAVNFALLSLDDTSSITGNLERISDIKKIPLLFTTNCYNEESPDIPYYRPILTLTFAIETILFGYNSKIYHFGNIYLFCFSLYLMYLLLVKLKFNEAISKFILLLLAVHPVISSTVAYVSPRAEILTAIFIVLSFIMLTDYLETKKIFFLIFYVLFYVIALFTKESALTFFPLYFVFVFLFDYKITFKEYIKLFIILLIPTIFYFVCRNAVVPQTDFLYFITNITTYTNFIKILIVYMSKILYPDYIHTILYNIHLSSKDITIAIIFILLTIIIFYKKLANRKLIIFSLLSVVTFLFPTVFLSENQVFYHRLFLPLFFLSMILIQVIDNLLKKYSFLKKIFPFCVIALIIVFSFKSFFNIDKYINSDIFWINMYKDAPNYHLSCFGLSKQYYLAGQYDKSLELINEARKLRDLYEYKITACNILMTQDKYDEAKKILFKLLEEKEAFEPVFYLSQIYYFEGNMEKAVEYAKQAYTIKENDELLLKHIKRLPGFDLNIHKLKE